MTPPLKLKIEELDIYLPIKGKLYSGTPSRAKPRDVKAEVWCADLMDLAHKNWKNNFAIPLSFWPDSIRPFGNQNGLDHVNYFHFVDNLGAIRRGQDITPSSWEIHPIIHCLLRGEDVLLLSASKNISGFLPAILVYLIHPEEHIEKLICPILDRGYLLTKNQHGYIAGLLDARHLTNLNIGGENFYGNDDEKDGGEYYDDDEKPVNNSKNIGLLEKQLYATRSCLESIGHEIFHDITHELMALTDFLGECQEHQNIDVTLGGFASISYRLCDVYKETAALGYNAGKILQEFASSECFKKENSEQLAMLQMQLENIADQLERLCTNQVNFIVCDLNVLQGHPEVAEASEFSNTVKLINDQLSEIQGYMEQLGTEARQFSLMQESDFKLAPPKKHKDWNAMRTILQECVQQACESAQAKIRAGGTEGHPPTEG